MRMWRLLALGATALLVLPGTALSQGTADIAKRTLDSGIAFYQSGDYKQALQDFMTVINSYSDSEWVDEALLHIARYHYEVENDLEKSREYLLRIQRDFAGSNSTPGAYFYLGQILFASADNVEQLRDGLANFERVSRLFPDSDVADQALFAASRVLTALQEYDPALEKLQLILMEHSESSLRKEAQYLVGEAYMFKDNIQQAMVEFQQVRNDYPDSPIAEKALDRLTMLYRLHFSSQAGITPFRRDTEFSLKAGTSLDDPMYLDFHRGSFYLADRGSNKVSKFDSQGKLLESMSANRPTAVKVISESDVTILADRQLKGTTTLSLTGDQAEPLTAIEAFSRGAFGRYYVWDKKPKLIHSFKADLSLEKIYRGREFRDVRDMETDRFGNLYVLDGKEKQVEVFDPNGSRLRVSGSRIAGDELRDPRYIEVDEANNLYILDRKIRKVLVLDPSGQPLTSLSYSDSVQDPRGLAVDSSGGIVIVDRKKRAAVRYH